MTVPHFKAQPTVSRHWRTVAGAPPLFGTRCVVPQQWDRPRVTPGAIALSLLVLLVITTVKLLWAELLGPPQPFLIYFAAILAAAWYGGWLLGGFATLLSALAGSLFFTHPASLSALTPADFGSLLVFLAEGATITVLANRLQMQRKAADEAARDAQLKLAKLKSVLGAVDDGITVQDAEGHLIYANEPAAALIGFDSAESLTCASAPEIMRRFELYGEHGEPLAVTELPGRAALRGATAPERLVCFRVRATGQERWALVRARPVQLDDGPSLFAVNAFHDVTELRERERALIVSHEWFATALRSIADAVIATDARGAVTFMNPVAEQLTGWPASDANARPLARVFRAVNEDTGEPCDGPVARVLREGCIVAPAEPSVLVSRTGAQHAIDDSAAPIRAHDGEIVGSVLVFRDVTRKRAMERQRAFLARAAEELGTSLGYRETLATIARLAVPTVADFCAVDLLEEGSPRRLAVEAADPARAQLAYEIARNHAERGPQSERLRSGESVFLPEVHEVQLAAQVHDEAQLVLVRRLNLRSYVEVPLRVRDRAIGAITLAMAESERRFTADDMALATGLADRAGLAVAHALHIEELARARTLAERANRAKDEFLAMLGHELRNPLAPIVTALELMKLRHCDAFARERAIVERQVRHLVRLVDDLLDVARIARGKIELEREPVALEDVVAKGLELASPLLEQRNHQVTVSVPASLRTYGDPARLAQVVSNLVTNAARFTPPHGHIQISGSAQREQIHLSVRDDGAGIEPTLLPRIFDSFVQGQQSLDRRNGGLGLGLSIVRSVVELHGGRAWAHSAGPGRGSEFHVQLPALRAAVPPPLPAAARPDCGTTTGQRVLLVDDNDDALELLANALRIAGHEILTAHDAAEALQIAAQAPPSLAVLDIGLPAMDGYELAAHLRALPGLAGLKLVALTGYGQASDKARTRAAGFARHLVKPISPSEVGAVVGQLLEQQS